MSRETYYQFVETDSASIIKSLIEKYENMTGRTLQPSDPDKLFISWVADALIQERVIQNYIGNQNIPSRAEGKNLDAIGEWIFNIKRKPAQPSKCRMKFKISEAQDTSIVIPSGTRVTNSGHTLIWSTSEDAMIEIGETSAEVDVQCETAGMIGNGYAEGQINILVDVDNILYYDSCSNVSESDGGCDEEDDDTYYEMMRSSLDSASTAGAQESYIFLAKSVSDEIADVKATCPVITRNESLQLYTDGNGIKSAFIGGGGLNTDTLSVYTHGGSVATSPVDDYIADYTNGLLKITIVSDGVLSAETEIDIQINQDRAGCVSIYALMNDGKIASETIKSAILAACNPDSARPMTDYVSVDDPQYVDYDIKFNYYIPRNTNISLNDISEAVNSAVEEYKIWQCQKLGRDINPSKLHELLMKTGIKRVEIISPSYTVLNNGENNIPQIARVVNETVTNGGYEDE